MAVSVPYTFTNNTIADADQVTADFTALLSYLNSSVATTDAGSLISGTLAVARLPASGVSASSLTPGTLPAARLPTRATSSSTVADPPGTTSASFVMSGLGSTLHITPLTTGTIVLRIEAVGLSTVAPASGGCSYALYYGSGTAPVNGAAVTGNSTGGQSAFAPGTGGMPFSLMAVVVGLSVGTPYWFDLAILAVISGTASVQRITGWAWELN